MANKRLTLLQAQRAKLKKQRALAKTDKAKQIISRKIQRVTVRIIEVQKQLTGSKPKGLLKAGQSKLSGSSTKGALPPGRTTPSGSPPSSRRAVATAKAAAAAQGSTGTRTRIANSSSTNAATAARVQRNDPTIKRVVRQHNASQTRGGPLTAAAAIIGDKIIKKVSPHIIRGGMKVLGKDTAGYDRGRSGKHTIKSVGGTDFNMSTKAGQQGYAKAIAKKNQSYKKNTSSSNYPTTAELKTRKPSKDFQKASKTAETKSGGKVTGSKPKTTVTKAPKRDRMEGKSSSARLKAWALANKKMIRKSGTKKQKAMLNKALDLGANDLKRYSTTA
mgnify:CR=1 FL=1